LGVGAWRLFFLPEPGPVGAAGQTVLAGHFLAAGQHEVDAAQQPVAHPVLEAAVLGRSLDEGLVHFATAKALAHALDQLFVPAGVYHAKTGAIKKQRSPGEPAKIVLPFVWMLGEGARGSLPDAGMTRTMLT